MSTPHHHQLLYISNLVAGVSYGVFAGICQVSRRRNAELGLVGVLLFDGHRFCQLLEGPTAALARVRNEAPPPDASGRVSEVLRRLADAA